MSMKKCFSALLIIVLMIQKPTFFNLASDRVAESLGALAYICLTENCMAADRRTGIWRQDGRFRIEAVNRSMNMKFNIF